MNPHLLHAFFVFPFKLFFLFGIRLALATVGVFVVAFALPFSAEVPGTRQANGWVLRKLPRWAWLWDNDRDGCLGDTSLRYWERDAYFKNFWLKCYWWLVFRNPLNNATREWPLFSLSLLDVTEWTYKGDYHVRDEIGEEGFQFVSAKTANGIYQGLYWVRRWGKSNRGICLQLGFKLYPRELVAPETEDGRISFTFEPNPFKDIS